MKLVAHLSRWMVALPLLDLAGRILDLCERRWEGNLLHLGDNIISADAKPTIQTRQRMRLRDAHLSGCLGRVPAVGCSAAQSPGGSNRLTGSSGGQ